MDVHLANDRRIVAAAAERYSLIYHRHYHQLLIPILASPLNLCFLDVYIP